MEKLRVATVFSGIGAFEQALQKLRVDYRIVFACDNGEREIKKTKKDISEYSEKYHFDNKRLNEYVNQLYAATQKDNLVKKSYFANYDIDDSRWFEDIRFIDGTQYTGKVDIFVGGSPCQSYSIIGKKAGLEDTRGTLFFDYARLVKEISPEVFIYENVPGMLVHDHGNTWKVIREVFESLGYHVFYHVLNAKNYGIPQDRKRLFVIGFKNPKTNFHFPEPIELKTTMFDYLEPEVNARHYLGEKGFEFVTNPKYKNRARVNRPIIETEKANQQFNWNGDFVFEDLTKVQSRPDVMERAYVGEYLGKRGVIRQMSHRECLRLMGFPDSFRIVVPNVAAYRQSGNSIVVDVLANVLKEIFKVALNETT
jgi:DNA (cytosine-5)-methyltransferase 1